jgi:hypothetical protein
MEGQKDLAEAEFEKERRVTQEGGIKPPLHFDGEKNKRK